MTKREGKNIYLHHYGAPLEEDTFQKIRSGLIDLHVELLRKKAAGDKVSIPMYRRGLHRETMKKQVLDFEKEVLAEGGLLDKMYLLEKLTIFTK